MPTLAFVIDRKGSSSRRELFSEKMPNRTSLTMRSLSRIVSEIARVPFLSPRRSVNGEARLNGSGNGSRAGKSAKNPVTDRRWSRVSWPSIRMLY
jgi:hypothetical protein